MALVACPFCREMFERTEAQRCPVCGVSLRPFQELPPSADALEQDGIALAPDAETLPWTYLPRGRGALAACCLVGLSLFFAPWIHVTMPDDFHLSGFDVARRLGWSWGPAVAWFVLLPTVLSRRTVRQLRGARVAAAFLALVPAVTVALLVARPPQGRLVPVRFSYLPSLYATAALSVVAFAFALRLGGRADDLRLRKGTSAGQVLH